LIDDFDDIRDYEGGIGQLHGEMENERERNGRDLRFGLKLIN